MPGIDVGGAARTGRHRERCGRSAGRRRDDLRIARNVVRSRRRRHADEVITAARAGRVAEVDVELVIAVRERDLPLLGRIVEAARRQRRRAAGIQQGECRPGNRCARQRVVDDAVRMDRQVQALQIGAGRHDDVADPLQSVRERRDRAAQHRGVRARARRAEPQFVADAGRVVRLDADEAIDAVGVRQYGLRQLVIRYSSTVQPASARSLESSNIVEVGVVPGRPVQHGEAGHGCRRRSRHWRWPSVWGCSRRPRPCS